MDNELALLAIHDQLSSRIDRLTERPDQKEVDLKALVREIVRELSLLEDKKDSSISSAILAMGDAVKSCIQPVEATLVEAEDKPVKFDIERDANGFMTTITARTVQ